MPLSTMPGWDKLAATKLAVDTATFTLTFPARELLEVHFNITGYSSSDIMSMRFNGDTGARYNHSYLQSSTAAPTSVNSGTTAQTLLRLGANAVTGARHGSAQIQNVNATSHPVTVQSMTASAATAAPTMSLGGGTWTAAAATQITSITFLNTGSPQFLAGTSVVVFGVNPF